LEEPLRKGVMFCKLASKVAHTKIKGVFQNPKTEGTCLSNIRKGLEALRKDPDMSQKYILDEKALYSTDKTVLLGLLEDMHRAYDRLPPRQRTQNYHADGPYLGSNPRHIQEEQMTIDFTNFPAAKERDTKTAKSQHQSVQRLKASSQSNSTLSRSPKINLSHPFPTDPQGVSNRMTSPTHETLTTGVSFISSANNTLRTIDVSSPTMHTLSHKISSPNTLKKTPELGAKCQNWMNSSKKSPFSGQKDVRMFTFNQRTSGHVSDFGTGGGYGGRGHGYNLLDDEDLRIAQEVVNEELKMSRMLKTWLVSLGLGQSQKPQDGRSTPGSRSQMNHPMEMGALELEGEHLVAWRDGLLLAELVSKLESKRVAGIERNPKNKPQMLHNIKKTLEALRGKQGVNLRYLFDEESIYAGDGRVIRGLLMDVKKAYKNRKITGSRSFVDLNTSGRMGLNSSKTEISGLGDGFAFGSYDNKVSM